MHISFGSADAAPIAGHPVTKSILILLAAMAGQQSCVTMSEKEREELAYDLNEARSIYEARREACLNSGAHMVTETLTGSRILTVSEMEWAYCTR